jgi:hypothetical protein
VLTLSGCFDNQNEVYKDKEKDAEFLNPGEDTAEAFQPAEEPFYFVAFLVQFAERGSSRQNAAAPSPGDLC